MTIDGRGWAVRLAGVSPFLDTIEQSIRTVSFSHFDRIRYSEACRTSHFPQIMDWLGRSLALPRE